ncbi:L-serine dehydratase [Pseudolycoriella hygida]|uniref:L-serine ammonia-lyase n=1 Tax=Pseudolycoriella hygida TaxID=35572 RepID=A0A9Q0N0M1_9DIPT|nr:L-serine dehydratase [Pseudolycoriella hygida]
MHDDFDLSVYKIAVETPLIESLPISKHTPNFDVYLKLENTQPCGSFKQRGIGLRCLKAKDDGYTKVISSSGGNAGLAVARSARVLGLKSTVVVPLTTNQHAISLLIEQQAEVIRHGPVWDKAHEYALKLVEDEKSTSCYIHAFDDPVVWEGHSSMILEISKQLPRQPKAIVLSCGGGGLLIGVLEGLKKLNWYSTEVIVVETHGASSFNLMTKSGGERARLEKITSRATTLGALEVAPRLVDDFWHSQFRISSLLVSDEESIQAIFNIVNDHRMLVEMSCSASIAAIYNGSVDELLKSKNIPSGDIVAILCGGSGINMNILDEFKSLIH